MTNENYEVETSIFQEELSEASKSNSSAGISLDCNTLATYPLLPEFDVRR